jgi:hypothetical protein
MEISIFEILHSRLVLPSLRAALIFFVLLLGTIQALAVALSLGGVRLNQLIAIFILAAATALAFIVSRSFEQGTPKVSSRAVLSLFSPLQFRLLLITALTLFGALGLLSCLTQDLSYDGNSYHIPIMNEWATSGYIQDADPAFDNSQFMNGYPKGAETVTFVVVQALNGKLVNSLNLLYAPLGFFGIALLCQLFGASPRDSLVFGAAYLIVPANAIQYSSTYVDAAFGSAAIALLALLASNLVVKRESWFVQALVIGCAIGNVIAIKGSGLLMVIVCLASFLAWAMMASRGVEKRLTVLLLLTCFSLVIATAAGGYWYIKDYVRHGSPLYPMGLTVAGHTVWPGQTTAETLNESRNTPREIHAMNPLQQLAVSWTTPLRSKPWSYPWSDNPLVEVDTRLGGLGIFWILGCVPAVLTCVYALMRRKVRHPQQRAIYYFLATAVFLAFIGMPMNWWARYTVWVFALGMPSVWLVLRAMHDSRSGVRRVARLWVAACFSLLILRAGMILLVVCIRPIAEIKPVEHRIPRIVFRSQRPLLPLFPEMRSPLLAEILNTQTAVGVGPRDLGLYTETIYGQLALPIGRRNLVPVTADATEADVDRIHSSEHVKYILWLTSMQVPAALALHVRTRGQDGPFTYLELITESF